MPWKERLSSKQWYLCCPGGRREAGRGRVVGEERAAQVSLAALRLLRSRMLWLCQVAQLKEQLRVVTSSPFEVKRRALEAKVAAIEAQAARREQELARLLEESRERASLEIRRLQAIHEEELEAKNRQLDHFRQELDAILEAVARQLPGRRAIQSGQTT